MLELELRRLIGAVWETWSCRHSDVVTTIQRTMIMALLVFPVSTYVKSDRRRRPADSKGGKKNMGDNKQ